MQALSHVALLLICTALIRHAVDAARRRPPPKGRCTGKCVKRSSLRWALMGNSADRCGPQYGCVNGCCRHAKPEEVRQRVEQCVQQFCWFHNQVCASPCNCYPPAGGWNPQNPNVVGFCLLIHK